MEPITYALYQGNELVMIGTKYLIAQQIGVKPETIENYASPSHLKRCAHGEKRRYAIRIDPEAAKRPGVKPVESACTEIVRLTRGRCMNAENGCFGLGFCVQAYTNATKELYEKRRGFNA